MSLVTLKRKVAAQRGTMSTGRAQFSLHGTVRLAGGVGQPSRPSAGPTPFRGAEPRGSGGCCGTYDRRPPVLAQPWRPDPPAVHRAVASAAGRLRHRLREKQRLYAKGRFQATDAGRREPRRAAACAPGEEEPWRATACHPCPPPAKRPGDLGRLSHGEYVLHLARCARRAGESRGPS